MHCTVFPNGKISSLSISFIYFQGCHTVSRKDLTRKNLNNNFKNITDFEDLRFLALDRKEWKKLEDI